MKTEFFTFFFHVREKNTIMKVIPFFLVEARIALSNKTDLTLTSALKLLCRNKMQTYQTAET